MTTALCPACDEEIRFTGSPKIGQRVRCTNCDSFADVVDLDPIELAWVSDDDSDDDDWGDDWDEEDDDE